MTDKNVPVEPTHPGPVDLQSAVEAAAVPSTPTAPRRPPLISAIEVENFKGIGKPVRIDLRPITLLFGRNSAGKSTVLQALCYAHELLSRRNADPHRVEIGGDRIDLGGFRRFVHGHDLDRVVRLRFDLSLKGWTVPDRLLRRIIEADPEAVMNEAMDEIPEEWFEAHAPAGFARSGWVTLAVKWDPSTDGPTLDSYEVGVNGSVVGRLQRDPAAGYGLTRLAYNSAHPLFHSLCRDGEPTPRTPATGEAAGMVREKGAETCLARAVVANLPSPTPNWKELLDLRGAELIAEGEDRPVFEARLSSMVVGIGDTLRAALADVRYVGPVRRLRPPTAHPPSTSKPGDWSDGSEAWNRLLRDDDPAPGARKLVDDVNEWLTRSDRLDTGYKLQRRSIVELPADDAPVTVIRSLERLPTAFRNKDGDVDLAEWLPKAATQVAALTEGDPQQVEAQILEFIDAEAREADSKRSPEDAGGLLIEAFGKAYRAVASRLAYIETLENGGPAVTNLIRKIASAPLRRTLDLVTAESELPVRTPEIGVGVSQLLPVVVAALDPDRPGITAIEQPELHAHPKLQVELGDLFAHAADDGRVFLLENHSEHLMLRLLRRIEETHNGELPEGKPALRPEQVSVVYLDQVDGEVQATRLRIDETGEFVDRWPHGFFEERDDELF